MEEALRLTDLLEIIFRLSLPSDPKKVHSRRQSPINVSQTCSLWRNVAISTHFLWSHLSVCSEESCCTQCTQEPRLLKLWSTWASRSRPEPLRFTISFTREDQWWARELDGENPYTTMGYPFLTFMAKNFERWRDVEVSDCPGYTLFLPTLPPSLERLVLSDDVIL